MQRRIDELAADPARPGVLTSGPECETSLLLEPVGQERAAGLPRVFKALADPVRLRLFSLIASHADGQACVCDITGAFDLTDATISHHLKVLRQAGLITGQRCGTWIYYRAQPEALAEVSAALMLAATTTSEVVGSW